MGHESDERLSPMTIATDIAASIKTKESRACAPWKRPRAMSWDRMNGGIVLIVRTSVNV